MRVAVLYTPAAEGAPPEDRDGEVQRDAVSSALSELGHEPTAVPFTPDLGSVIGTLGALRPDRVFNLVESVGGEDRLIHLAPSVLEALRLPYTGAPLDAMLLTTNKIVAKCVMSAAGIPTPPWWQVEGARAGPATFSPSRVILKPIWDHGSPEIGEHSIVELAGPGDALSLLRARDRKRRLFAEAFVDGREFSVSLMASDGGILALPPIEMRFRDYGSDRFKVLCYRAKWDLSSFEHAHTARCFDFGPGDDGLLGRLELLARDCWRVFGLRGYARVDFRVDGGGRPWVLEVNANPCVAPDSSFLSALEEAGLTLRDAVRAILADAVCPPGAGTMETCRVGEGMA